MKEIRVKFYRREKIDKYFKEFERESILRNEEKKTKKISKRTGEKTSRRTREETTLKRIRKKEHFKKDWKVF